MIYSVEARSRAAERHRMYELSPAGAQELDRGVLALAGVSDRIEAFVSRYESSVAVEQGLRVSRRLPSQVARTMRRRALEGLNPLRGRPYRLRQSHPDGTSKRRRADHA